MSAKSIIPSVVTELKHGPSIPAALRRVVYGVAKAAFDQGALDGAQTIAELRRQLEWLEGEIARGAYPLLLPIGDPIGDQHRAYRCSRHGQPMGARHDR